ncbi:MAG: dehydrogenase [Candidatus Omnitrophica bacterium]|nr:dehydrogenase [Candidatus Omnitrophota bacterium]MCF7891890.1 dehydrogenase [Candidatus Omnitrophota bacterium]MCF7895440.1 dehydrogenase [Candidatus Omnitrophota bacterium]MCF7897951.1 dehydrogenase [Candidatus Omnitrophota bacterium]MCF7909611.1 dehydrogenase [Candidatus Omnitrophota bacterium]
MEKSRKGPIIFSTIKPFAGLKESLKIGRSEVLDQVRNSNIRGRGGAGFPTGVKWNLTATATDNKKYVICNADEGEPGTFKDRVLLGEYAKLVFEGMVICAFAVGADEGILYLRGEYISFLPELDKTLNQMRKDNLLGENILSKKGFNFDIKIRLGVGAYVCGEETSLIESLEGHRGEPRNKPPFPTNTGFNGHPTVINNVETFAAIAHVVLKGATWFKSFGTDKSSGSKLISVSGDCRKPGVYEIPFGTTLKKVLKMVDAKDTKAVQVGGASGTCVSKKDFKRMIAFEDLSTGGSIIIFNQKRNLLDVAENFLNFFAEESCGQCTPCREGIPVLIEKLKKIKNIKATKGDIEDIFSLAETMQLASKCGLGQTASDALISILNSFKKEYTLAKS